MVLIVVNLATHILSKSTPSFLENPLASVNFPLIFKLGLNSAFKWKNLVSTVCTCVAWVPIPRGRVHVLVPRTRTRYLGTTMVRTQTYPHVP